MTINGYERPQSFRNDGAGHLREQLSLHIENATIAAINRKHGVVKFTRDCMVQLIDDFIKKIEAKPQELTLDSSIAELELPVRTCNTLAAAKILRIRDLEDWPPHELQCLEEVGPKTVEHISNRLREAGILFWIELFLPNSEGKRYGRKS